MKIADANTFLRYLIEDQPESLPEAKRIIENELIFLPNEIIAEIVYVLQKVYQLPRMEIKDILVSVCEYPNIYISDFDVIINALDFYSNHNLDFIDCLLLSYNKTQKVEIFTFDSKLLKHLND